MIEAWVAVMALAVYVVGFFAWADFAGERFDWSFPWQYLSTLAWPLVVFVLAGWRMRVKVLGGTFEPPTLAEKYIEERMDRTFPERPAPATTMRLGPIRAYRHWKIHYWPENNSYRLMSLHSGTAWEGPIQRANRTPTFHVRPAKNAAWGPGLYAWTLTGAPWGWVSDDGTVVASAEGEVDLMGRVIRHERGYRAEVVRIRRLMVRNLPGPEEVNAEIVRQLSKRYDCDVTVLPHQDINLDDLRAPDVPDDDGEAPIRSTHDAGLITMADVMAAVNAFRPPTGRVRPSLHHLGHGSVALSNCVILGSVTNGHR